MGLLKTVGNAIGNAVKNVGNAAGYAPRAGYNRRV